MPFPAQGVGEGLRFCTNPILHPPKMQRFRGEHVCWFGFAGLFHISTIIVAFAVVIIPRVWGGLHPWEKGSKLSLSFRTHRLFLFQIRGICRALCSHHPHVNPWQWECRSALSHKHPPCLQQQQRLEAAPHMAELLSIGTPAQPKATLSEIIFQANFFPVPSSRCLFSRLSGSNRDEEEGKVLRRQSRRPLGSPTCSLEGEGMRELKSDTGSFHSEMAQHCQEGFFHCTVTIGLMTGKLIISTSCLPSSMEQEPRNTWAVGAHSDAVS